MKALLAGSLLLLAACSGNGEPPAVRTTTGKPLAERVPAADGVAHVGKINDALYRGAQPDGEKGYAELAKEKGIRTVICLRKFHGSEEEAKKAGLNYVAIPITANIQSTPPSDEQVKLFFETVLDPAKQPVYFHCLHGKDRTGTMAAIYRIEVDGWTSEEAVEELHSFGYHTYYKDLIKFIRDYTPRGFAAPK